MFNELNNIYRKSQKPRYRYTVQDLAVPREAIKLLQRTVDYWNEKINGSTMDFYYVFILPTKWDYNTREESIRPLFVEAGIIHKDDGKDRLIFFTELEATFRSMQEENYGMTSLEMKLGDQFVLCTVDLREKGFKVNLELVSVQYPSLTATNSSYVPQLLKAVQFMIPFSSEKFRSSLMSCLKERCNIIMCPESIERMLKQSISLYQVDTVSKDWDVKIHRKKALLFFVAKNYNPFRKSFMSSTLS